MVTGVHCLTSFHSFDALHVFEFTICFFGGLNSLSAPQILLRLRDVKPDPSSKPSV